MQRILFVVRNYPGRAILQSRVSHAVVRIEIVSNGIVIFTGP